MNFSSEFSTMKLIVLTVFSLCLAVYTEGWVARGQTDPDKLKGHPDECWINDLGYIRNGETKRLPKQCAEVTCSGNGGYSVAGCISVSVEPPCVIDDGDLSKPYPDCCFEKKCPDKNKKQ